MFTLHYILPIFIYLFNHDKIMLMGLLIGNIIDLDHLFCKKIKWNHSAIKKYGNDAIFGFYPLHNYKVMGILVVVMVICILVDFIPPIFLWVIVGALFNQILDIIAKHAGFML